MAFPLITAHGIRSWILSPSTIARCLTAGGTLTPTPERDLLDSTVENNAIDLMGTARETSSHASPHHWALLRGIRLSLCSRTPSGNGSVARPRRACGLNPSREESKEYPRVPPPFLEEPFGRAFRREIRAKGKQPRIQGTR